MKLMTLIEIYVGHELSLNHLKLIRVVTLCLGTVYRGVNVK